MQTCKFLGYFFNFLLVSILAGPGRGGSSAKSHTIKMAEMYLSMGLKKTFQPISRQTSNTCRTGSQCFRGAAGTLA